MANYVINSPSLSTEGSNSGDYYLIQSGALSGTTILGGSGADTIEALASATSANGILFQTKGGADKVFLSGSNNSGTLQVGAGGDTITLTGANAGFHGSILGGDGSDILDINNTVNLTGVAIKMGAGADLITGDSLTVLTAASMYLGAGADTVNLTANGFDSGTIVGGGGADKITLDMGTVVANDLRIEGDYSGVYGADTIEINGTAGSASILGQGGKDLITISGNIAAGTGQVLGGAGNDTLAFSGTSTLGTANSAFTIGGGNGDDSISLNAFGNGVGSHVTAGAVTFDAQGGAGNDTINVMASYVVTAGANGAAYTAGGASTIFGGAGTDSIYFSGTLGTAGTLNGVGLTAGTHGIASLVEYSDYSESTTDGYDTVSLSVQANASAGLLIGVDSLDSASVGTFNNGNGTQVSNGVLVSAGTDVSAVTDRISAIDAGLVKTGAVALFTDADNSAAYLFMQGGSTDLVVKLENRAAAWGNVASALSVSAGAGFGGGSSMRIVLG